MDEPINIIGGGLAGLGLGLCLRARGVLVAVHEAGAYPRARVCGEFLCGISEEELRLLGIADLFKRAATHRSTAWFLWREGRPFYEVALPCAAYGISRDYLDHAMAGRFEAAGGTLNVGSRKVMGGEAANGTVWAAGRPMRREGPWIGLKCHLEDFDLIADLEVHLGRDAYMGLTRVEDGRVNCCGLFHQQPEEPPLLGRGEDPAERMAVALASRGFSALAERLGRARGEPGSMVGIHRFHIGWQGGGEDAGDALVCRVGDAAAIIPPFTGNGMSMALQSALMAAPVLEAYARGRQTWQEVCQSIRERQARVFSRRMRWAGLAHPFLLSGGGQRILYHLARMRILPFRTLFRLTHG